jgi:hypothetical protein
MKRPVPVESASALTDGKGAMKRCQAGKTGSVTYFTIFSVSLGCSPRCANSFSRAFWTW